MGLSFSGSQPPVVVLKADDLSFAPDTLLSERWLRFVRFVEERGVRASIGVIGNRLEEADEAALSFVRSLAEGGRFEFWNHGYTHGKE
ncbi:hypothetical protein [Paenibacillus koleovorans]|uniref:hypothetical protein n=1 Tax=Paenibacillus koleovorans TaxID=121608 RepID=UPI000FD89D81|nr:hypothetical protein [Paenibacillus koleovorans]